MWPKPRPDIVRKTGTRQRRSSGPEKVELARAYAQTNSEARYTTAGSFSTVRRKKKVKPRIRPDRGQKIAILPCSITPFPALVAGTYPPYRLGHRCRWTEIARQPKLSSGVETYLLSACAATSYLLTLGMSFCSRCRRSTSSQTRRVVSGSALFWIMASSLATLGVFTGDTSLCLPLGFRDRCASRGVPRFPA